MCVGPQDLLVLAVRRGDGQVEVPVVGDAGVQPAVGHGHGGEGCGRGCCGGGALELLVHGATGQGHIHTLQCIASINKL